MPRLMALKIYRFDTAMLMMTVFIVHVTFIFRIFEYDAKEVTMLFSKDALKALSEKLTEKGDKNG